jgi:hypothetical protein
MGRGDRPAMRYWLWKMLHKNFLCSRRFAQSDFCTSERVCLNTVAVPHGSDSSSHSIPQPLQPSLYIPLLNSLPTLLTVDRNFHVLPPTRTYSKVSVFSCTEAPTPVHAGSPSVSSEISPFQTPPQVNTFAVEELVDGIASSVARISIPWWCKRRNRLVIEDVRQRVTKRKMTTQLCQ